MNYELLTTENAPVKMWTKGVPVEADARQQLINTAKMPFIFKHIAVMPDVHLGKGSTIGSVIPTKGAIIPAAVGVDICCGMNALRTALTAADLIWQSCVRQLKLRYRTGVLPDVVNVIKAHGKISLLTSALNGPIWKRLSVVNATISAFP